MSAISSNAFVLDPSEPGSRVEHTWVEHGFFNERMQRDGSLFRVVMTLKPSDIDGHSIVEIRLQVMVGGYTFPSRLFDTHPRVWQEVGVVLQVVPRFTAAGTVVYGLCERLPGGIRWIDGDVFVRYDHAERAHDATPPLARTPAGPLSFHVPSTGPGMPELAFRTRPTPQMREVHPHLPGVMYTVHAFSNAVLRCYAEWLRDMQRDYLIPNRVIEENMPTRGVRARRRREEDGREGRVPPPATGSNAMHRRLRASTPPLG